MSAFLAADSAALTISAWLSPSVNDVNPFKDTPSIKDPRRLWMIDCVCSLLGRE